MSWQETSPGHFERPFDSIELFYKTVTDGYTRTSPDREHWTVSVSARFKWHSRLGDAQSALRQAWKQMRYDHPQIACFAQDGRKIYETPNTAALESWLADTFIVTRAQTADDILASAPPSPLSTLYYLPESSQVVLRSSHWRIDGIGALHLLNNFFTALATPRHIDFGTEGRNLSPGLDEAADFPTDTSEDDKRAATQLFTSYTDNLPSLSLPVTSTDQIPSATRRSTLTLSPTTTNTMTSACRKHNLTVTTALHTALVLTTKQLASPSPSPSPSSSSSSAKNYTSFGSFNLRPYLQPPYNTAAHPVSVYSIGLPLTLTPSTFFENAVQLREFYKQLSPPSSTQNAKIPSYLADYIRKMTGSVKESLPASAPVAAPPVLVNLGKVDNFVERTFRGDIVLEEFFLATEVLTTQLTFYVWTWRGSMCFSVCYNEGFYTEDFVRGFVERVKGVLFEGLGVIVSE